MEPSCSSVALDIYFLEASTLLVCFLYETVFLTFADVFMSTQQLASHGTVMTV